MWLVITAGVGASTPSAVSGAGEAVRLPGEGDEQRANRAQFGTFTSEQRALLAKQGFFVAPAQHLQLYDVYESNDYLVIPNFISSDAVLQLYHIFYDYSLREMEGERLIPLAEKLTGPALCPPAVTVNSGTA
jgi:hypothetical protein